MENPFVSHTLSTPMQLCSYTKQKNHQLLHPFLSKSFMFLTPAYSDQQRKRMLCLCLQFYLEVTSCQLEETRAVSTI